MRRKDQNDLTFTTTGPQNFNPNLGRKGAGTLEAIQTATHPRETAPD
ncbi:MAG: hypothetical protein ABJH45_22930 [Paracoccaceae bacterium]